MAALLLCVASCSDQASAPPPEAQRNSEKLAPGMVARVGDQVIDVGMVAAIASRQTLSVRQARDAAVRDALHAAGAPGRLPESELKAAEQRVLARAMLRQLGAEAGAAPTTEEELTAATRERWLSVDRPRGFRSVHAVVRLEKGDDAAKRAAAKALAEKLRAAVQPLSSDIGSFKMPKYDDRQRFDSVRVASIDPATAEFKRLVKAIPKGDQEVRSEPLQVVAKDGRVLDVRARGGRYDDAFATAISKLSKRGELSEVAESAFGFHVILLLEVIPEIRLSRRKRLEQLRELVLRVRVGRLQEQLMEAGRSKTTVEIKTNADSLMELVKTGE